VDFTQHIVAVDDRIFIQFIIHHIGDDDVDQKRQRANDQRTGGCREQAATLVGSQIFVSRDQLPATAEDEYYWSDLEGLEVKTTSGELLGRVEKLMETGANDVLVIRGNREHLVPFVPGQYVKHVDLEGGMIEVDWDPEF